MTTGGRTKRAGGALAVLALLGFAAFGVAIAATQKPSQPPLATGPMAWAYPAAATEKAAEDFFKHQDRYTLPGSRLSLTEAQLDDAWNAVDWRPEQHPPAPPVVLHGRQPEVYACGLCHMTNGQGGHGVPGLAGLSRDYIAAQVAAFATGQRHSSYRLRDVANMVQVARAARPAEVAAAADYYARLPYRPWIRMVEAAQVPVTAPSYWGWTEAAPGPRRQPIGQSIVEVAEDRQRSGMSDPQSGFIAYVPPGAVARGRALAEHGVGGQPPCAACHGPGLTGGGPAPSLAGRSPTYLARQLWDLRTGARKGPGTEPMQPVAKGMDAGAMVDVAAYLGSLGR